jgi:hypothetical protein
MCGLHLGDPKTPRSRRTVQLSEEIAAVLARQVDGRAGNPFVFTTTTGRPLHGADFYERVWHPLHDRLREAACRRSGSRTSGTSTPHPLTRIAAC